MWKMFLHLHFNQNLMMMMNGLSIVRAKQSSLCFICSLGTSKICLDKYIRPLGKYQFLLFPHRERSAADSRQRGCGFEPHLRHCVVVLEQDTFILALYWLSPGRPVPV